MNDGLADAVERDVFRELCEKGGQRLPPFEPLRQAGRGEGKLHYVVAGKHVQE